MDLVLVTKDSRLYEVLEKDLTSWGYRVIWGKTKREALLVLGSGGAPVLALIDEDIDREYGLSIVQALRKRSQAPYQYLILLCAHDEKKEQRGLLLGAALSCTF